MMSSFVVEQRIADKWLELSQRSGYLCTCFGIFAYDGGLDVVYEHISGESLQKIIASFDHFRENLVAVFALQIFKGLDLLHNNELVHGYYSYKISHHFL